MSAAQIVITTIAGAAVALGVWLGIARDGFRRRRERNDVLDWFNTDRPVLAVAEADFAAQMLMLRPATPVVAGIVDAAFERVEASIRDGVVPTPDDARQRLRTAVRAGLMAKMAEDYDRAKRHGADRNDMPGVNPDGSVPPEARAHLESMPPEDRFRFMTERLNVHQIF